MGHNKNPRFIFYLKKWKNKIWKQNILKTKILKKEKKFFQALIKSAVKSQGSSRNQGQVGTLENYLSPKLDSNLLTCNWTFVVYGPEKHIIKKTPQHF